MSYGIGGVSSASGTDPTDQNAQYSLRPFANLNLTEDQRTQIRSIFQNAKQSNQTPQQVQSQIAAVLTPAQQQQLQTDLQTLKAHGGGGHHGGHHHKASATDNDVPPSPISNLIANGSSSSTSSSSTSTTTKDSDGDNDGS